MFFFTKYYIIGKKSVKLQHSSLTHFQNQENLRVAYVMNQKEALTKKVS